MNRPRGLLIALFTLIFVAGSVVLSWDSNTSTRETPAMPAPPDADRVMGTDNATMSGAAPGAQQPGRAVELAKVSPSDPQALPPVVIPAHPAEHLDELKQQVAIGSADAAMALYRMTIRCSPAALVPRTDLELAQHVERITAMRQTPLGEVVENQETTVEEVERLYAFCRYVWDNDISDHLYWMRTAAELGHHMAMARYYLARYADLMTASEDVSAEQLAVVRADGRAFLERARDEGSVEAFMTIGLSRAGVVNGPYERDMAQAFAHMSAAAHAQYALMVDRERRGVYADGGVSRDQDLARLELFQRLARQFEFEAPAYELDGARELAADLLERCCG